MNRRSLLGMGAAALGGSAVAFSTSAAPDHSGLRLTPQATQGPFWFDPEMIRADITGGRDGLDLGLDLTVLEADGRPVSQALIEIWHCDAQGHYSGYANQSGFGRRDKAAGKFLRGGQVTNLGGQVEFKTLYPGWYQGRAPHMHVKVMLSQNTVLTSQIFLPDALNEFIYSSVPAYKRAEVRDTLNSQDGIAQSLAHFTAADIREEADRYRASMVLVVDRSARSNEPSFGDGPPPGVDGRGLPPGFGPPPGGAGLGPPPGVSSGFGPPSGGPPGFGAPLRGDERLKALIPGLKKA